MTLDTKLQDRLKVYEALEKKNGRDHQLLVAIEELSELQKELTKLLRKDSYTNRKKICEELADVKIVCEQLDRFFDPDYEIVPTVVDFKIKRLLMFYLEDEKASD